MEEKKLCHFQLIKKEEVQIFILHGQSQKNTTDYSPGIAAPR
jgi:predicted phosphodiesterase